MADQGEKRSEVDSAAYVIADRPIHWWSNWRSWLSLVVPMRMTTEFCAHTGVPWRVHWWQWRHRIFRTGGQPIGPRIPEWASPCDCHDADGVRIRSKQ